MSLQDQLKPASQVYKAQLEAFACSSNFPAYMAGAVKFLVCVYVWDTAPAQANCRTYSRSSCYTPPPPMPLMKPQLPSCMRGVSRACMTLGLSGYRLASGIWKDPGKATLEGHELFFKGLLAIPHPLLKDPNHGTPSLSTSCPNVVLGSHWGCPFCGSFRGSGILMMKWFSLAL